MTKVSTPAGDVITWIGGTTYPHRAAIKAAGGRWEGGAWVITEGEFQAADLGALGLWSKTAAKTLPGAYVPFAWRSRRSAER